MQRGAPKMDTEGEGDDRENGDGHGEVHNERPFTPAMTTTQNPNLLDVEEELVAPALNNMALCALYTCRMRAAVALFEGLIREDPTKYLTECMVFNLCTLYELGSDHQVSERKKRILQLVAKRFMLHDVGAYKLQRSNQ